MHAPLPVQVLVVMLVLVLVFVEALSMRCPGLRPQLLLCLRPSLWRQQLCHDICSAEAVT